MPSSLKEEEAGGGEGVPERHEEPELLLAPGDTEERPPQAPNKQNGSRRHTYRILPTC